MATNKWLDLPIGPLSQIFTNLNPIDMLLGVPLVCKNWGRILCEIIFFDENNNLLDFRPLFDAPFCRIFFGSEPMNSRAMKLMHLLVGVIHAFALDGESDAGTCAVRNSPILEIAFPPGLPFYDKHLVYIAERCPELKSLLLPCSENITDKGITKAMRFWTGMEKLTYGPFCGAHLQGRFSRTIEEIGINCRNLQFLQLDFFDLHWQSADILVRNLKSLKSLKLLCFFYVIVHKYGLQIFLSRCKKLDGVKFSCCCFGKRNGRYYLKEINMTRIQEGRRTRWRIDAFNANDKLFTSKELVDQLFESDEYI